MLFSACRKFQHNSLHGAALHTVATTHAQGNAALPFVSHGPSVDGQTMACKKIVEHPASELMQYNVLWFIAGHLASLNS